MKQVFTILVVMTACLGCYPADRLPQTTLPETGKGRCECGCFEGGVCTCGVNCPPVAAIQVVRAELPQTPGIATSRRVVHRGVVKTAKEAFDTHAAYDCPVVAFVGCPARSVEGAIAYPCKGLPRIVVGNDQDEVACLETTATDAEIQTACKKVRKKITRAPAFVPVPVQMFELNRSGFGACPNCR